ncbi:MAG: PRC-barrel domain-containing protein [Trichloromonadaceae bacterium]
MKKLSIVTIFMFALGLYVAPATFATGTDSKDKKDKQTGQDQYQKDQQGQKGQQLGQQKQNLMLVSHLTGSQIQNQQGEKIGDIDRVLVDLNNGQIAFVTVASGGVLGIGEDKYIVPFNALQKKMTEGNAMGDRKVVFTINKKIDQLKEVPGGDIEEALTVESQSRGIHEHYGVSPYWEGNQRQLQRQDDTKTPMSKDQKHDPKMMDKKDNQKNMPKY